MSLVDQIKQLANKYAGDVVDNRRHLHMNPELSFEEFNTAKFVAEQLRAIGLDPQEGIAKTGVSALIKGKNPGKRVLALRADIDALPIKEENDVPYKSQNEGVIEIYQSVKNAIGTYKKLHRKIGIIENYSGRAAHLNRG